jgi:DNA-binding NtrC family response regulator
MRFAEFMRRVRIPERGLNFDGVVGDFEAALIRLALERNNGNVLRTAKFLRLNYSTLQMKCQKAGIKTGVKNEEVY